MPRGLPLFSVWLHLRPVAAVADALYAWVARNRYRFPGRASLASEPARDLEAETAAEIGRRLNAEPRP